MAGTVRKGILLHGATLSAAFAASACCLVPLTAASLGLGVFAVGARLEPYRPLFLALAALLLGLGFYREYRPRRCGARNACAMQQPRRLRRALLWSVGALTLLLAAFPYYMRWIA